MTIYDLKPGAVIRVVKKFLDYHGQEFPEGKVLHFVQRNVVPYHDGHTVHCREAIIYLCGLDDTAAVLQNHNDEYFALIGQEPNLVQTWQTLQALHLDPGESVGAGPQKRVAVPRPTARRAVGSLGIRMNHTGLIVLQVVGALSILPYPFVLLANIMSIAATGSNAATRVPWAVLSFYPIFWIGLYVFAWRAMARGQIGVAFGLSAIPALACLMVLGLYVFSWVGFGLGQMGVGNGGLHVQTYPNNPLLDSIVLAGQNVELPPRRAVAVEMALRQMEASPSLVNLSVPGKGSPLNVALGNLVVSLDGTINGNSEREQAEIRLVRALAAHGARLNADESTDLRKTWALRRVLHEGSVTTRSENPLVWRIVTHDSGDSKPFNPLTDPVPPRPDGPAPFFLKPSELPLLSQSTQLHGTPLYAALLDDQEDACRVIIRAGGRLSAEEARNPAAAAALKLLFERNRDLRPSYDKDR